MSSKKEQRRICDVIWERPIQYTRGMLAIPIPPEPDAPVPIYWLKNRRGELLFVNASNDTLTQVRASLNGFETCDEDVLSVSNGVGYTYDAVKTNEAVRIELFDAQLDSDYHFFMSIETDSPSRGKEQFSTRLEKGKISSQVLLWNNDDLCP